MRGVLVFLVVSLIGVEALAACLSCHRGIETISAVPEMAALSCTDCHRGNGKTTDKEEAHRGLWANPSDLRVVDETCGRCHAEIVRRLRKSLHATSAGIISGARYTWAAQKTKEALYANYAVRDEDGEVPRERGARKSLRALPTYDPSRPVSPENHPVDDYLRAECLRCHVWTRGKETYGDYRASGCAACHVIYADDGLYRGGDRALDRRKPGRPRFHRLTRKIPSFQCVHCHNRGGRTGVSFFGMMESAGYGAPWSDKPGKKAGKKIHGKYYDHLLPDIHHERGLSCIDCHTSRELHGDGNIYSKKEQAVEIECVSCHGTVKEEASLRTSWGNPLPHVRRRGREVILTAKLTGKEHRVPQVKEVVRKNPAASAAMEIPGHAQRLECYACHARWAPQCYGCHVQQDLTERAGDWLSYGPSADPSRKARAANRLPRAFRWRETRSYLRWESPALGVNSEGLVAPFVPGCQVIFTQVDEKGARFLNHVFRTADGTYGLASNPIQPHTVRPKARTCEDCHTNPKALGLGTGIYLSRANGLDIPFELERLVTDDGKQLQATSHVGARPFNGEELRRLRRINLCAACHTFERDPALWKEVLDRYGRAADETEHQRVLQELLKEAR
ncbi:MAG: hypothetical protein GXO17_00280 [Thermodesulfobacteria bacterium]|nr:hypothetical protein [Thermodesulfobacteriota bacterium]